MLYCVKCIQIESKRKYELKLKAELKHHNIQNEHGSRNNTWIYVKKLQGEFECFVRHSVAVVDVNQALGINAAALHQTDEAQDIEGVLLILFLAQDKEPECSTCEVADRTIVIYVFLDRNSYIMTEFRAEKRAIVVGHDL